MVCCFSHHRVENTVAGEAKDVVDVIVVAPLHSFGAAIVTIAAPDDVGFFPRCSRLKAPCQMPDHGAHFAPVWCLRGPQDRRHRQAGACVIHMHRCKAALVMMRIPQRHLLPAMGCIECVVDIKDITMRRRDPRGELINQCTGKSARIPLRGRILKAAYGRLRGKCCARLRQAPDGHLQRRIITQPVVVDGIFPAAADAEYARTDDLCEAVMDARRIAPVGQRCRQPRDDADLLLGRPQQ